MMGSVSDIIEHYLKKILNESTTGVIEIKRSELADFFQCVPSQINYVISTRFTLEKGYMVESKRGGGGFIRIKKVVLESNQDYFETLLEQIGDSVSQLTAEHIIARLLDDKLIHPRESLLFQRIISRDVLQLPLPLRDQVRARMMRELISTIFTSKGE